MEKKVRFGDLVRSSGRPEVITLWAKPADNPVLTAAINQNRVLTVIQEPGRTDFGLIGFHLRPGAAYLIFPRTLSHEPNARVIGVNYQLVEQPEFTAPAAAQKAKPVRTRTQPKATVPKPRIQRFKVKVRRTATVEKELTLEAADRPAAERRAIEEMNGEPFDLAEAKVQTEALNTQ